MTEDFLPAILCVFKQKLTPLYELSVKTLKSTFDFFEEASGHESAMIIFKNFEEQGGVGHIERISDDASDSLKLEIEILTHMLNRYK